MKQSAGIVIILNDEILLCRPTNKKLREKPGFMDNLWGPPKGGIDSGETALSAAIRETREEIGIKISRDMISNINKPIVVDYKNKSMFVYKRVFLYVVKIKSLSEIGLDTKDIPTSFLQEEEIDKAYFMNKFEATQKIFHRFTTVLDLI